MIGDSLVAVAVDWKPTALYLRYQHSVELVKITSFSAVVCSFTLIFFSPQLHEFLIDCRLQIILKVFRIYE